MKKRLFLLLLMIVPCIFMLTGCVGGDAQKTGLVVTPTASELLDNYDEKTRTFNFIYEEGQYIDNSYFSYEFRKGDGSILQLEQYEVYITTDYSEWSSVGEYDIEFGYYDVETNKDYKTSMKITVSPKLIDLPVAIQTRYGYTTENIYFDFECDFDHCTVEGSTWGKDLGSYTAQFYLNDSNYKWNGYTEDVYTITFEIEPQQIPIPTPLTTGGAVDGSEYDCDYLFEYAFKGIEDYEYVADKQGFTGFAGISKSILARCSYTYNCEHRNTMLSTEPNLGYTNPYSVTLTLPEGLEFDDGQQSHTFTFRIKRKTIAPMTLKDSTDIANGYLSVSQGSNIADYKDKLTGNIFVDNPEFHKYWDTFLSYSSSEFYPTIENVDDVLNPVYTNSATFIHLKDSLYFEKVEGADYRVPYRCERTDIYNAYGLDTDFEDGNDEGSVLSAEVYYKNITTTLNVNAYLINGWRMTDLVMRNYSKVEQTIYYPDGELDKPLKLGDNAIIGYITDNVYRRTPAKIKINFKVCPAPVDLSRCVWSTDETHFEYNFAYKDEDYHFNITNIDVITHDAQGYPILPGEDGSRTLKLRYIYNDINSTDNPKTENLGEMGYHVVIAMPADGIQSQYYTFENNRYHYYIEKCDISDLPMSEWSSGDLTFMGGKPLTMPEILNYPADVKVEYTYEQQIGYQNYQPIEVPVDAGTYKITATILNDEEHYILPSVLTAHYYYRPEQIEVDFSAQYDGPTVFAYTGETFAPNPIYEASIDLSTIGTVEILHKKVNSSETPNTTGFSEAGKYITYIKITLNDVNDGNYDFLDLYTTNLYSIEWEIVTDIITSITVGDKEITAKELVERQFLLLGEALTITVGRDYDLYINNTSKSNTFTFTEQNKSEEIRIQINHDYTMVFETTIKCADLTATPIAQTNIRTDSTNNQKYVTVESSYNITPSNGYQIHLTDENETPLDPTNFIILKDKCPGSLTIKTFVDYANILGAEVPQNITYISQENVNILLVDRLYFDEQLIYFHGVEDLGKTMTYNFSKMKDELYINAYSGFNIDVNVTMNDGSTLYRFVSKSYSISLTNAYNIASVEFSYSGTHIITINPVMDYTPIESLTFQTIDIATQQQNCLVGYRDMANHFTYEITKDCIVTGINVVLKDSTHTYTIKETDDKDFNPANIKPRVVYINVYDADSKLVRVVKADINRSINFGFDETVIKDYMLLTHDYYTFHVIGKKSDLTYNFTYQINGEEVDKFTAKVGEFDYTISAHITLNDVEYTVKYDFAGFYSGNWEMYFDQIGLLLPGQETIDQAYIPYTTSNYYIRNNYGSYSELHKQDSYYGLTYGQMLFITDELLANRFIIATPKNDTVVLNTASFVASNHSLNWVLTLNITVNDNARQVSLFVQKYEPTDIEVKAYLGSVSYWYGSEHYYHINKNTSSLSMNLSSSQFVYINTADILTYGVMLDDEGNLLKVLYRYGNRFYFEKAGDYTILLTGHDGTRKKINLTVTGTFTGEIYSFDYEGKHYAINTSLEGVNLVGFEEVADKTYAAILEVDEEFLVAGNQIVINDKEYNIIKSYPDTFIDFKHYEDFLEIRLTIYLVPKTK